MEWGGSGWTERRGAVKKCMHGCGGVWCGVGSIGVVERNVMEVSGLVGLRAV